MTRTGLWSFPTGGVIGFSSAAVSKEGSVVCIESGDANVYAIQFKCDVGLAGSDC